MVLGKNLRQGVKGKEGNERMPIPIVFEKGLREKFASGGETTGLARVKNR